MVARLSPAADTPDQTDVLEDRDFLESAVMNPAGPERARLNELIRTHGFAGVGRHRLRRNARYVLGQHGIALGDASRVLLSRLVIAGYQQPSYLEYTAVPVLCRTDEAIRHAAPDVVARVALRTVADVLDFLSRLPQLASHPDRTRLEERIAAARELCASLAFGPARTEGPEVEEPDEDPIEHGAMFPESGIPEELIFQGVTQPSEVIFTAAHLLAYRAGVHITHDQAALAATDLHYAAIVERPLLPLLGLLVSMDVPTWLGIRPFIERPGAIQSPGFRALRGDYLELKRISEHPRYPEHEQSRIGWIRESLTEAVENFDRWQAAHRGIALRYTPGGSHGTLWLEAQVAPIIQERRAARKGASTTHESPPGDEPDTPPARGSPMGH